MIRRLRRRHARMTLAMGLAAPLILAAALVVRPAPASGPLPPELDGPGLVEHVPPARPRARLEQDGASLLLLLPEDWAEPDVLAYRGSAAGAGGALPDDARFLGSTVGRRAARFPWGPGPGVVLLYSLARGELVLTLVPEEGSPP